MEKDTTLREIQYRVTVLKDIFMTHMRDYEIRAAENLGVKNPQSLSTDEFKKAYKHAFKRRAHESYHDDNQDTIKAYTQDKKAARLYVDRAEAQDSLEVEVEAGDDFTASGATASSADGPEMAVYNPAFAEQQQKQQQAKAKRSTGRRSNKSGKGPRRPFRENAGNEATFNQTSNTPSDHGVGGGVFVREVYGFDIGAMFAEQPYGTYTAINKLPNGEIVAAIIISNTPELLAVYEFANNELKGFVLNKLTGEMTEVHGFVDPGVSNNVNFTLLQASASFAQQELITAANEDIYNIAPVEFDFAA